MPIVVALAVYYVAVDNFFAWDDFIWLDKARTFSRHWTYIFRLEEAKYFDPFIHLMFVADSLIAGVNPHWYHSVDLAIHAANSVLVYLLGRKISGDTKSGLYCGILFAGSFAIADAVLWPSSRVDLVSTFFSLASLIQFLKYLRSDGKKHFISSSIFFLLALAAKGTPLILPAALLWLMLVEKKPVKAAIGLMPFVATAVCYSVLLAAAIPHPPHTDTVLWNMKNIVLAFSALFVPENIIVRYGANVTALPLLVVVSVMGLFPARERGLFILRITGFIFIFIAILPVIFTTDFKLVSTGANPSFLLNSPSHRIYLASVGAALLGGGVLRTLEILLGRAHAALATMAVTVLLGTIVTGDAMMVRARDRIWEFVGNEYREEFAGLLPYRGQVGEGSQVGLISFTGSSGFLIPMMKVCFQIDDVTHLNPVMIGGIDDIRVLQKIPQTFLFLHGRDRRIYDLTQEYRQLLLLNRLVLANPTIPEYRTQCASMTNSLLGFVYGMM